MQHISVKKETVRIALDATVLFIAIWLARSAWWIARTFRGVTMGKLIYHASSSRESVASWVFQYYTTDVLLGTLGVLFIYLGVRVWIAMGARLGGPRLARICRTIARPWIQTIIVVLVLLGCLGYAAIKLHVPEYIAAVRTPSTFIEDNYVDPRTAHVEFPEEKRNLLYIYLESMENTYGGVDVGGIEPVSLIPNLTRRTFAPNTVSFSHTDGLGGFYNAEGTNWTAAAMVAQTAGIPIMFTLRSAASIDYDEFLPGAFALGDVLAREGYQQTLLVGSNGVFGQREAYFTTHGDYRIFDLRYVEEHELIDERSGTWGFNDYLLFDFAKDELTRMAAEPEPFNLTMLTVDTHFSDGDVCPLCVEEFDMQYQFVIACADRQIEEFLRWVEAQPWFEDTTVIVVGDHVTMDITYNETVPDDFEQTVYNLFLNVAPGVEPAPGATTQRTFIATDLYPTTLAAMGARVPGDRLGLGTNLFSGTPTLAERYGVERLHEEFQRFSRFYADEILRDPR
ncbi:MAG: LTA synthase family protein [Coriobacteriia bacterium]|nr:LTA synthase family protein [Coriobacteriia bacterium]